MVVSARVQKVGLLLNISLDVYHHFLVASGCVLPGKCHRSAFIEQARSVAREDCFRIFTILIFLTNLIFEILDLRGSHGSATPQVLLL